MSDSVFFSTPRTADELDRDHSPSRFIPSLDAVIAGWAARSAVAEARHAAVLRHGLAYGAHPREALDYYATGPRGAALLIYIHGGFWQALSKAESGFIVGGWPEHGVHVAVLDHVLAPEATLPEIVTQIRRGLHWLLDHAAELGFDAARVVVAGHSAGAHLAAMSQCLVAPVPLAGLALVSGVFELEAVRQSHVNDLVQMTALEAAELSPARLRPVHLPVLVAAGENEPFAFHEHSRLLAWEWREAGCPVQALFLPRHDHFSILDDLARPDSVLGAAVGKLLNA